MKKQHDMMPGILLSLFGMAFLITVFLLWFGDGSGVSIPGLIAALVSAGLFATVCLRFVPEWMRFWSKAPNRCLRGGAQSCDASARPKFMELKIFVTLLVLNAGIVLLVYILRVAMGHGESFLESLNFWTCTDSEHYLDIARDWYLSEGDWDRVVQLVFLPGYPLVVRFFALIVGNYVHAGLLVSALCFSGAGCVLYRLLLLDHSHEDALRTIKYFCILPGVFFFTAPMSESLFLLLCACCLYFARTKKWLLGCVFGGLAAFTRSVGITLFVPLLFELVSSTVKTWDHKAVWHGVRTLLLRVAALFIVPAGFGVYCFINYQVSGNPFQFMEYESAYWSQHMGWFFNTASYQIDLAISCFRTNIHNLLGLWLPNLLASFGSLILMIFAVKKMRPSYVAWFIAYFVMTMGATWLLSAPRYLLALIPVPLAVALLTKKPVANWIVTACCVVVGFLYLCAFVMRWQVW